MEPTRSQSGKTQPGQALGRGLWGWGGAYVAIDKDANSLFVNPAGIAKTKGFQFSSSYTVLLGDIYYSNLAVSYPTDYGVVGLGYIASGVSDIPSVLLDANGRPIYSSATYSNYINNVLIATYSSPLERFFKTNMDIDMGVNLKYFFRGFTGTISQMAAGFDADLGIQYSPNDRLTLGIAQMNFIPTSMGGKVVWASGYEDSIASLTRAGLTYKILPELLYSFEMRGRLTDPNMPSTMHMGFEWNPINLANFRVGLDQSIDARNRVYTNYVFGVGVELSGWHVDYCYHPYFEFPTNTTQYTSISYYEEPPKKVTVKQTKTIEVYSPVDKTKTYDKEIKVMLHTKLIKDVLVDGKKVVLDKNGSFEGMVPLNVGKNSLTMEFVDYENNKEYRKYRILRFATFSDVTKDNKAFDSITMLSTARVLDGYPMGVFLPDKNLTRAEFASILSKHYTFDKTKPTTDFPDLPKKHWAYWGIQDVVQNGIMEGYPDGLFRPDNTIIRAEGITTIVQFDDVEKYKKFEAPFSDVPGRHWAAGAILCAKEAGLLKPILTDSLFLPRQKITRAEMSSVIYLTKIGKEWVRILLDWENGY